MGKTATAKVDLTKVKPYGDTLNDGMVQLSLPSPCLTETRRVRQL